MKDCVNLILQKLDEYRKDDLKQLYKKLNNSSNLFRDRFPTDDQNFNLFKRLAVNNICNLIQLNISCLPIWCRSGIVRTTFLQIFFNSIGLNVITKKYHSENIECKYYRLVLLNTVDDIFSYFKEYERHIKFLTEDLDLQIIDKYRSSIYLDWSHWNK